MRRSTLAFYLALLFLSIFVVLPLIIAFGTGDLDTFIDVLKTPSVLSILRFTLLQAVISTFLAFAAGLPAAYYYSRHNDGLSSLLYYTTYIPFFLPGISMVVGFLVLLGRYGLINNFIAAVGLERQQFLYSFGAILLGHTFYNSPITLRIVGNALKNLPAEIIEAGRVDGSSRLRLFWSLELPLIVPAILSSLILTFSYCFTSFAVVLILGGSQYATLEVAIYMYLKLLARPEIAMGLALVQFVFIFAFGLFGTFFESRISLPTGSRMSYKKSWFFLVALLYLIFEWLPVFSGVFGSVYDFRRSTFFFDKISSLFSFEQLEILGTSILATIFRSLILSLVAAFVATTISFIISWSAQNSKFENISIRLTSLVCISITPAILALGYIIAYKALPPQFSMVLLYTVVSFPVVINLFHAEMASFDSAIVEAAKIDGARFWQILRYIVVPVLKPAIVTGFAITFAIAMGEFSGSLILGGDKAPTMTVAIYRMLSSKHIPEARLLSSLLVIIVLIVIYAINRLSMGFRRKI
ncbi:MAG: iron ABC transporter permease [Kosmotoga sp.]|uniref:ABC transporter permease n=1 Tax=Kosmotoga sp. TaxID=1955248 RepID=UPI001DD55892|nr:iron ABC transporter permease [Kosmotoga sp.]MBO8166247.1 iron ABC transporter permease [Kosmotoga sp.]